MTAVLMFIGREGFKVSHYHRSIRLQPTQLGVNMLGRIVATTEKISMKEGRYR